MRHGYYGYNKEQLLANPKMKLICMEDNAAVFYQMAKQMTEEILANQEKNRRTVLICPVGPVGQYPYFVDMVNEQGISLKNVWFINMDEYLDGEKKWVPMSHPLSFRGFMERAVYSQIRPELNVPEGQRVFPDPENLAYIPELIEKLGGVDVCFGGIGLNGHLAFNEADPSKSPEEFIALETRVLPISPETRAANAIGDFGGALEDMPQYCVTVGIYEIAHARKIRLGCFRNWHRAVVRRAGYGDATADFPVTLLQDHKDITLTFTEYVGRLSDE